MIEISRKFTLFINGIVSQFNSNADFKPLFKSLQIDRYSESSIHTPKMTLNWQTKSRRLCVYLQSNMVYL